MNVVIANRQRTRKISVRLLKQIVGGLLAELKITEAELGISLVAAPAMTLVNETFLHHEGSTDVITFDHSESVPPASCRHNNSELPAGCRQHVYGELFICVDQAVLQAKQFGTSWQSEVVRYVVHGVLHLLGHDDLAAAARRRMKRAENRLVRRLAARFALAQLSRAVKLDA